MTLPKGYLRKWYKRKFAELRKQYGNKCYFCHTSTDLEFAHIEPTSLKGMGRGRQQRYYDIKNNPTKYLLTCKKHNELAEIDFRVRMYIDILRCDNSAHALPYYGSLCK